MCDKKFGRKGHLASHIKNIHMKTKDQLHIHLNADNLKFRPHQCDICKSTFILKGNLDTHVLNFHQKKKVPFEVVKKEFSPKSHLSLRTIIS